MKIIPTQTIEKWTPKAQRAAFAKSSSEVQKALKRFPRRMWDFSPGPGVKWCIREVLWHLADSEAHAYVRLRQAASTPGSLVAAWNQEHWSEACGYRALDPMEALKLFQTLRGLNASLLKRLPDTAWERTVQHSEQGTRSLRQVVAMNIWHVANHVGQMERRLADWKARKPK